MVDQPSDKKSFWRRETPLTLTAHWVIAAALSYWVLKLFMSQAAAFQVTVGLILLVILVAVIKKLKRKE